VGKVFGGGRGTAKGTASNDREKNRAEMGGKKRGIRNAPVMIKIPKRHGSVPFERKKKAIKCDDDGQNGAKTRGCGFPEVIRSKKRQITRLGGEYYRYLDRRGN